MEIITGEYCIIPYFTVHQFTKLRTTEKTINELGRSLKQSLNNMKRLQIIEDVEDRGVMWRHCVAEAKYQLGY